MRAESQQPTLEQRVLDFISEHHLLLRQPQLPVAVSGGADSVCLLHILFKLRDELGVRLHVAHLDHQLRGADAEADACYVADLAHRLGIPATIERCDVKAYQIQHRLSPEEAAREARYSFLSRVAKAIGADRVAVGHTANDNIETILMHLIRGSGTRGLRGLQPKSRWQSSENDVTVIRPLLTVSREETAAYCQRHQLNPRFDVSNLSLSPLRNRIRLHLLPLLQPYNPAVKEALLRTARIASDDFAFLEKEATRLWSETAQKQEGSIILDKKKFLALPSALQRHLLRMALETLSGSLKDVESRHIEEIMDALDKPAGRRISLPRDLLFSIEYERYVLSPDPAVLSPFPALQGELPLNVPGETLLPGWRVEASITDRGEMMGNEAEGRAYFDFNKTGNKLTLRQWQRGDRFYPLGLGQPKKVGEFMIDAGIPRAWRERIPIVCSLKHIIWVMGWRIDDRVKVTEDTGQVLCLKFEPRK